MRTNEFLWAMQDQHPELKIEAIETDTSFGTKHYTIAIYDMVTMEGEIAVRREANSDEERTVELLREEGAAPFLDCDFMATGETFEDAVRDFMERYKIW